MGNMKDGGREVYYGSLALYQVLSSGYIARNEQNWKWGIEEEYDLGGVVGEESK